VVRTVAASTSVAADGTQASIQTVAFGTVAPARFERRLSLAADDPVLRAQYRIENLDVRPLSFTWGIHPTFAVGHTHRIDLPATAMLVGESSSPELGEPGDVYPWPSMPDPTSATGERDVSLVRGREAAVFGGHWATDLADGWLALTDTMTRRGLAIVFDREVFPHAWLWQVYGGWRGHHHVALEAWTSLPMDLDGAIAAGRARTLAPGEVLETEVAFVLYEGRKRVLGVKRSAGTIAVR
jgi:galactose mutarotase-like enzyme